MYHFFHLKSGFIQEEMFKFLSNIPTLQFALVVTE